MPTGYTEKILEGCSFKEFALGCACAFFYDCSNIDDIIPKENLRINHYREEFVLATKQYNDFCKLDDEELLGIYDKYKKAKNELNDEHNKYVKSQEEAIKKNTKDKNETREKYENMLKIIKEWQCPEENKNLKEFMIKQINESIEHDCVHYEMSILSYNEWVLGRKESLLREMNLYGEDLIKLEKNLLETKKWIELLKKSLEKDND